MEFQVNGGDNVELDGSASLDPDGVIGTFLWEQISGPEVELSDPSIASPSFTAPFSNNDVELKFSLTVKDAEEQLPMTDTVKVTVLSSSSGSPGPIKKQQQQQRLFY